jgi:hypothetical protein
MEVPALERLISSKNRSVYLPPGARISEVLLLERCPHIEISLYQRPSSGQGKFFFALINFVPIFKL